ncbi:MAG: NACHT domain-containing protein, partial [Cyanobacteria bacterium J06632_19]
MSQLPRENFDSQQLNASIPQNTMEGDRNRAVQGNDNKAVIGDENTVIEGNNNSILNIKELILGQPATAIDNSTRPRNQRILLAEVKKEVIGRLKQSLHNAVLINLGKYLQPQQVKCPWDAEIKIGQKPPKPLADNTSIISVFDDSAIAGKLLILGAPGSGKTTTLLELTQTLVNRAQEQPDYPIPVLFNLSSWKDDCQSLIDWLVDELKSRYGASDKLCKEWLENHQLLPMLDGLDELAANRQESCVVAINQFLQSEYRPQFLVVCSRYEEYSNYETLLSINGAICLQPLAEAKIRNYLIDVGQKKLWQTFQNDSTLLELMKTPLFLSISVLCATELDQIDWHELSSTEAKVEHLLDAYIRQMLSRSKSSKTTYAKQKTPSRRQTRYWLAYLASQLNKSNSSEFLIERMQFSWLGKEDRKSFSKLHTKFGEYFIFIYLTASFLLIFVLMSFPKQLDYLSKLIPESILILLTLVLVLGTFLFFETFLSNPFQKKIPTVEKIEWKLDKKELFFHQCLLGGFLLSIYGFICQYIGGFITFL